MTSRITTDADGDVLSIEKSPTRIFVDFTRTLNLGDYNSAKASVNIEASIPLDATDEDVKIGIRNAFFVAKQAVFDQLGLESTTTPEGFVREALERAGLSAVEVTQGEVERAVEQAAASKAASTPAKTEDKDVAWDDLRQDILANGLDGLKRWWNNIDESKGTRKPQFKARRTNQRVVEGVALWVDKAPAEVKQLIDA